MTKDKVDYAPFPPYAPFLRLGKLRKYWQKFKNYWQNLRDRYRNLPPHKKEVINVIAVLISIHIFLNLIYLIPAEFWTFNIIEWNLLTLSAYTSVGALYLVLRTRYSIYARIDVAKAEIYDRLGIPFVSKLIEVGQRLDARFAKLSPEQRERVINLIRRTADTGFDRLKELAQPPPRKKIVKLEEKVKSHQS